MKTQQLLSVWLRSAGPADRDVPNNRQRWDQLVAEAIRTGLSGLLLEQFNIHNIKPPAHIADRLQCAAMQGAAHQINLMRELERILKVFQSANIPVMLLKGAALTKTIYSRPDLRPMSDLDLLIKPEDAQRTLNVLTQNGCRRGFDLIRADFFPTYHYEVELITNAPVPARIDLHVRPFRPLRLSQTMREDALWKNAHTVQFGDAQALIPSTETMFIHLAAHSAYHGNSRLIWLYDIKRFVDQYDSLMDWSAVVESAREWKLSLPVLNAIESCTKIFGRVCSQEVIQRLQKHPINWKDRWTLWQSPRDSSGPVAHLLCNFLCTPGYRHRAGYLVAHLIPDAGHLSEIYPWRHIGWKLCAHGLRIIRAPIRLLHGAFRSITQRMMPRKLSGLSRPVPLNE